MLKTLHAVNSLLGTILGIAVVGLLGAGGYLGYRALYADKFALRETESRLAEREREIRDLSSDVQSKGRQIALLGEQLDSSRKQITLLSRDVQEKEETIGLLHEEVSQKAETIAQQGEQISALEEDLEAKQREIEQLQVALHLLKVDHRVARIDVLSQEGSAEEGNLVTTVSFVELAPDGKPLETPRVFRIEGDVIYVSSLVVKFTDENVELGDPLRSTSVCLFQKIFGETQEPRDGYSLDPEGSQPAAYRTGGKMSEFERQLWARFWDYANDPALAEKAGVRAAHGEAPFQKLMPGKRYKLLLRASGGLTIVPEELPAASHAETL